MKGLRVDKERGETGDRRYVRGVRRLPQVEWGDICQAQGIKQSNTCQLRMTGLQQRKMNFEAILMRIILIFQSL